MCILKILLTQQWENVIIRLSNVEKWDIQGFDS